MEIFAGAIIAASVGMFARAANRRQAAARKLKFTNEGIGEFPCRVSWESKIGKSSFVYGKLHIDGNRCLHFTNKRHSDTTIPGNMPVHRKKSWRTGLTILICTTDTGEAIRIMLSDSDAETVMDAVWQTRSAPAY